MKRPLLLWIAAGALAGCFTSKGAAPPSSSQRSVVEAPRRDQDESYELALGTRTARLWLPAGYPVARGIVVYVNMASGDTRVAPTKWQALGRLTGFGYLGTKGFGGKANGADGAALLEALELFAAKSGRPELRHAPFIGAGFSNGGNFAFALNAWKPERVIAFNADKGGLYDRIVPSEAALRTPGILVAGAKDSEVRRTNLRRAFADNRPRGALWAFLEQEGTGHDTNGTHHLFLTFFARAIARRYPPGQTPLRGPVALRPVDEAEGWLADNETWTSGETKIAPYAAYAGERRTASWLLDGEVAALYQALATYGAVDAIANPQGVSVPAGQSIPLALTPARLPAGWTGIEIFDGSRKIGDVAAGLTSFDLRLPAGLHGIHGVIAAPEGRRHLKPLTFAVYGPGTAQPQVPGGGVPIVEVTPPPAPLPQSAQPLTPSVPQPRRP